MSTIAPGLNHLCLRVRDLNESLTCNDRLMSLMGWSPRDARYAVVLLVQGATATESPAECPRYSDSYDAVFFTDPSGIALEFCYTSNLTH